MTKHVIELLDNMFHLIVLLAVIFVFTAGTLAFTPQSPSENPNKNSVLGISSSDLEASDSTRSIKYQPTVGTINGVEVQKFEKNGGGYLSRIIINQTQYTTLDQSIVMVHNYSYSPKGFKLIFRMDPKILQTYLLTAKVNSTYVPIQVNNYGYFETTLQVPAGESDTLGINLNAFNQYISNVGIEMELVEF